MAIWHGEKGRKETGGLIRRHRKKRKYELGNLPVMTKIGEEVRKRYRSKGGGIKVKAFSVKYANVFDRKTGRSKKVEILDVVENPSDPQLVRRKVITKGAVIKTELGLARVTSRPGQDGVVNAILLEGSE